MQITNLSLSHANTYALSHTPMQIIPIHHTDSKYSHRHEIINQGSPVYPRPEHDSYKRNETHITTVTETLRRPTQRQQDLARERRRQTEQEQTTQFLLSYL